MISEITGTIIHINDPWVTMVDEETGRLVCVNWPEAMKLNKDLPNVIEEEKKSTKKIKHSDNPGSSNGRTQPSDG